MEHKLRWKHSFELNNCFMKFGLPIFGWYAISKSFIVNIYLFKRRKFPFGEISNSHKLRASVIIYFTVFTIKVACDHSFQLLRMIWHEQFDGLTCYIAFQHWVFDGLWELLCCLNLGISFRILNFSQSCNEELQNNMLMCAGHANHYHFLCEYSYSHLVILVTLIT